MTSLVTPRTAANGIYDYDSTKMDWKSIGGKDDAFQKAVHTDPERGMFVGLVAMEDYANTGLHIHTAPASNYFLTGKLTDWVAEQGNGDFVINPTGATHDAFCVARAVFVGKLDGPLYYASDEAAFQMNNSPLQGEVTNDHPELPADIVVPLERQRPMPTTIGGLSRNVLWDYAGETVDHRVVKFQLLPGTGLPRHSITGLTHWFVLGGEVTVNERRQRAGAFMVLEPETELAVRSEFGALVLAWAEGPVRYADGQIRPDLYGY